MLARVKVVLTAAVTWIGALSLLAGEVVANATDYPTPLVRGAAWVLAAIAIIRRSTPVAPSERGLL